MPFMDSGLLAYEHRNQCPWCLCSRHVMFGCDSLRPCGGLMRPLAEKCDDPRLIITECDGCGFRGVTYDEGWWAQLGPHEQALMINVAVAEMKRQNQDPVGWFMVRPEHRTPAPEIPRDQLGTRTRVARRPWAQNRVSG